MKEREKGKVLARKASIRMFLINAVILSLLPKTGTTCFVLELQLKTVGVSHTQQFSFQDGSRPVNKHKGYL